MNLLFTNLDFLDEQILYIGVEQTKLVQWKMCFDRTVNQKGNSVRAALISRTGALIPIVVRLCYPCTNNIAKYEACIIGLKVVIDLGITELEVFSNSPLVIFQVIGE